MKNIITIFQMAVSILLVVMILLQTRGTGFSRSFSNTGSSFTRRGLEKLVFRLTFVLAGLFILLSVLSLWL